VTWQARSMVRCTCPACSDVSCCCLHKDGICWLHVDCRSIGTQAFFFTTTHIPYVITIGTEYKVLGLYIPKNRGGGPQLLEKN
jgi:hypothetical protein